MTSQGPYDLGQILSTADCAAAQELLVDALGAHSLGE